MAETRSTIQKESVADLFFHLKWKSNDVVHTEGFHANRVNMWRDILPSGLLDSLSGKSVGERFQMPLENDDIVPPFNDQKQLTIKNDQFNRQFKTEITTEPRLGRFYPKGMLKGIAGIFKANLQPFRCVGINNGHLTVDFNHPLAGKDMDLSVIVGKVERKNDERGGTSNDWMEILTTGPGMQARWQRQKTDYFADDPFSRTDSKPDAVFYQAARLVHHLDDIAREMISNTYGRFLANGMHVLDLMASWESHLPANLHLDHLVGLGLNKEELKRNSQLNDYVVHDMNQNGLLPFDSNTFDAVINTASVEYLTDPIAAFKEVLRILKPEGYFIVTFSNRWFPTKAIKIWQDIHEFERMGLVLEYFLASGGFKDLHTYSVRGLPRPYDDKYFPELLYSDPVFAVWGRKKFGR